MAYSQVGALIILPILGVFIYSIVRAMLALMFNPSRPEIIVSVQEDVVRVMIVLAIALVLLDETLWSRVISVILTGLLKPIGMSVPTFKNIADLAEYVTGKLIAGWNTSLSLLVAAAAGYFAVSILSSLSVDVIIASLKPFIFLEPLKTFLQYAILFSLIEVAILRPLAIVAATVISLLYPLLLAAALIALCFRQTQRLGVTLLVFSIVLPLAMIISVSVGELISKALQGYTQQLATSISQMASAKIQQPIAVPPWIIKQYTSLLNNFIGSASSIASFIITFFANLLESILFFIAISFSWRLAQSVSI